MTCSGVMLAMKHLACSLMPRLDGAHLRANRTNVRGVMGATVSTIQVGLVDFRW